jgi:hypothetical protein
MAGNFCEKYMRNIQMMMAVHPFSKSFSPAVGGSQNVARVSRTITVEQKDNSRSKRCSDRLDYKRVIMSFGWSGTASIYWATVPALDGRW